MRGHDIAVAVIGIVGLSCKNGDELLVERFTNATAFLESKFVGFEAKTKSDQPCYPLIDGWVRYRHQELGIAVAKEVREFEAYFDFATVVLDVYKTPVGDRFNALALKYQNWKSGPYAAAIKACKSCMGAGENEDGERVPLRSDLEACRTP